MSNKLVRFLAVNGIQKVFIVANVMKDEIPLLLSRSTMKIAQIIMNFDDDTAQVLGSKVKLHCIVTCHYNCIPLTKHLIPDKNSD